MKRNTKMDWCVNKLKGFMFVVLLFFSSFWGSLVFGGFLLPIFFLWPSAYRQLYDYMIGLWMWFAAVSVLFVKITFFSTATVILIVHIVVET